MQVVALAPALAVLGALPLQEDVQVGQVVALRNAEVRVHAVRLLLFLGGLSKIYASARRAAPTFGTDSIATITAISAVQPYFSPITIIFCK